jgi:hypothetical protein
MMHEMRQPELIAKPVVPIAHGVSLLASSNSSVNSPRRGNYPDQLAFPREPGEEKLGMLKTVAELLPVEWQQTHDPVVCRSARVECVFARKPDGLP